MNQISEKANTQMPEHLTALYEESITDYHNSQRTATWFQRGDGDMGQTDVVEHKASAGTESPIKRAYLGIQLGMANFSLIWQGSHDIVHSQFKGT